MFGILVLLFTLVPAAEIYFLIKIGGIIGGFNTILVVIITGIVGAALAKSQGLAIIQKIQTELNKGALPADQFIHGLLVFGGGLLLLTPGFLTDIFGLSMVFPLTRFFMIGFVKELIEKGVKNGNIHVHTASSGFAYQEKDNSYDKVSDSIEADFIRKEDNNEYN